MTVLPAFPKIEEFRSEANRELIKKLAAQLVPVLGMVAHHIQFEGRRSTIIRHDDTVRHTPLHAVTGELRFSPLPLVSFTDEELLNRLKHLAEQLARGLAEHFHAEMDRATTAVGNVVDAGGQPLSEELLLKMLEKMQHTFEPDGTWKPPTLLASPEVIDRLMRNANGTTSGSMEFDKSLKKLLEKKRDEYRHREADRILAG